MARSLRCYESVKYGGGNHSFGTSAYNFTRACAFMRGIRFYKQLMRLSKSRGDYVEMFRYADEVADNRRQYKRSMVEAWRLRIKERRQLPVVVA